MNSADALLTRYVIANGGSEAQPIMAQLIAAGMPYFLGYKLVTTNMFLLFLAAAMAKKFWIAEAGIKGLTCAYAGVFINHIWNIFFVS